MVPQPAYDALSAAYDKLSDAYSQQGHALALLMVQADRDSARIGSLERVLGEARAELVKTMVTADGTTELRAVTGPDYGRIWDHELVGAIRNMVGGTDWKVPGVLDWSTMHHNPNVDVTKDTTTLYASDRDVFVFLVDDRNPIEAGRLPNGEPDLYFRGFYAWNSEVGSTVLGIASFYLRGVCQNRNLWGVEGMEEIKIRHSKFAANRFAAEATPALASFARSSPDSFISGVKAARDAKVASDDDERGAFLRKRGFGKGDTQAIIDAVFREEGHPAETVYDFVQGITALARTKTHQDARLAMEKQAKRLMEAV